MLKIFICEDERKQREYLEKIIREYCIIQGVDAHLEMSTDSPKEILEGVDTTIPSLYYLDVDLHQDMNGIELAKEIRNKGGQSFLVFVTTHSEMTPLTFQYKVEAMDYIIKDNAGNLKRKITECIDVAITRQVQSIDDNARIKIMMDDVAIYLGFQEILYFETTEIKHKVRVCTLNRILEFCGELKQIEELLDQRFIRCHKSIIVNKDKIQMLDRKKNEITLCNQVVLPCSRTAKKALI